jgi:hypothetical protein
MIPYICIPILSYSSTWYLPRYLPIGTCLAKYTKTDVRLVRMSIQDWGDLQRASRSMLSVSLGHDLIQQSSPTRSKVAPAYICGLRMIFCMYQSGRSFANNAQTSDLLRSSPRGGQRLTSTLRSNHMRQGDPVADVNTYVDTVAPTECPRLQRPKT